jgi:hypothetical protein
VKVVRHSTKVTVNPAFQSEANTAALLRYQPALQALAALRSSKRSDYINGTSQAREAARIIAAGNQQASGGLADFLSRIGQQAPTGPSQSEAQIVAQNLGLTGQAAGAMLANSTSRAAQGAVYQQQGLRKNYLSDVGQIDQQAQNIADQYGTFASDAYSKLVTADQQAAAKAANAAANRKNARIVAGVGPDGKVIPGGKADKPAKTKHTGTLPGGAKPATNEAFAGFQRSYQAGQSLAPRFAAKVRQGKLSFTDAVTALAGGIDSGTKTVVTINPLNGKPLLNRDGTPKTHQEKVPGVKGVGDALAARVAIEYALNNGKISRATAKALHARGITAKRLGIPVLTPTEEAAKTLSAGVNNVASLPSIGL